MSIKKILLGFLFIIFISCKRDGVQIQYKIQPNYNYSKNLTISSISEINFEADEETLKSIESYGHKLPIQTEATLNLMLDISTGKRSETNEINAFKEYVKADSYTIINGNKREEKKPFSDVKLLGKFNVQGKFIIDSIVGEQLTPQMRYFHSEIIDNYEKKINFPVKEIKVGDKITGNMKLDIPVQGMETVKASIKLTYILREVNRNKAVFESILEAELDPMWGQDNIELVGEGKGTVVFDLDENLLVEYNYELPMDLTIIIGDKITAKIDITMFHNQQMEIN